MNPRKTKKQAETEAFVDEYIAKFGYPPSYRMVADKFKVSVSSADFRLRDYKEKMRSRKPGPLTEKDLVSFGNYLLSPLRKMLIKDHPEFGKDTIKERLSQVHHADIQNWKFKNYATKSN